METLLSRILSYKYVEYQFPFIITDNHTIDYAQFHFLVNKISHQLLGSGLHSRDRIAIYFPNVIEFVLSYYAVLKLGGTVVPINILHSFQDVTAILESANVKAMIYWSEFNDEIKHIAPQHNPQFQFLKLGDDGQGYIVDKASAASFLPPYTLSEKEHEAAVIQFSSGMSGAPKGAMLSHRAITYTADSLQDLFNLSSDDIFLASLPLFHPVGHLHILNAALWVEGKVVLQTRFDAVQVLDAIEQQQVSVLIGVPGMFASIVNAQREQPRDVSSLRVCISWGGVVSEQILTGVTDVLRVPLIESYGSVEGCGLFSINRLYGKRKEHSIGYPIEGVEMAVVNESGTILSSEERGEIVVQGETLMSGYVNSNGENFLNRGWFYTGDIGYLDNDGFFHMVDRKEDVILKGLFPVFPNEVEEVLLQHPKVTEVAVVGKPDHMRIEEVQAFVVPVKDESVIEQELVDFCLERLPKFKCPHGITFVSSLPKGTTGKILKQTLRAELSQ